MIGGDDLCRVSVESADLPVDEVTGDDDRASWWRNPTGAKSITDDQEQQPTSNAASAAS